METKPTFRRNGNGVKSSSDMYRNINGIHYVQLTSNPDSFEEAKLYGIKNGLKVKVIKDELFIEKRND